MQADAADRPRGTIRSEWAQHWRAGVAVTLAIALGYTVWPSVASLFVQPLQQAFGWSRGQIALAYNATLIASLLAPGIGMFVDRVGPRPILLGALAMVAVFYLLLAAMPGVLWVFYGLSVAITIFGMGTAAVSHSRIIVGAFRDTRGTALAITRGGFAVSVALLPPLLFAVMGRWGFRAGFVTLGLLIILVALPAGWRWLPRREARAPGPRAPKGPAPARIVALLKNPRVAIICLAAALNYAPVFAVISQLKPLAMEKALPPGLAVAAVSTLGLASLAGALFSGFLIDRLWAPGVAVALNLLCAAGCLLLFSAHPSAVSFTTGVLLIGLGQGAEIDIIAFILARWFGLRSYATLFGLMTTCIGAAAAISAILIGVVYDRSGSYQAALAGCGVSFVAAALLYLSMGRAPAQA